MKVPGRVEEMHVLTSEEVLESDALEEDSEYWLTLSKNIDILIAMIATEIDEKIARRLKILGHPDRLRILRLLASPERFPHNLVDSRQVGICVNDLAKAAGLPQSTTSHHLSLMQEAGLVVSTEHGSWRYIRPNLQTFRDLATAIAGLAPGS